MYSTRKPICKWLMLGGFFLTFCGAKTYPATPQPVARPAFTVRLYNGGSASERDIFELEQNATAIFRDAGIDMVWINCSRTGAQRLAFTQPGASSGQTVLWLRVVNHLDRGGPFVLGWTTPDSSVVTVQYSRAQQMAHTSKGGVSSGQILGHVAAHEMGHVLLASTAHAAFGVMKPTYDKWDLLNMVHSHLLFTAQESRVLRARLGTHAARSLVP